MSGEQGSDCSLFLSFQGKTCLSLEQGAGPLSAHGNSPLNSGSPVTWLPLCRVTWPSSSESPLGTGAQGAGPKMTLLSLRVINSPSL